MWRRRGRLGAFSARRSGWLGDVIRDRDRLPVLVGRDDDLREVQSSSGAVGLCCFLILPQCGVSKSGGGGMRDLEVLLDIRPRWGGGGRRGGSRVRGGVGGVTREGQPLSVS